METSPVCNKCDNGWIIYKDNNGYEVAKECSCRKERIMQNRLRFANIPAAFREMTLSNFKFDVYRMPESKAIMNTVVGIIKAYLKELEGSLETGKGLYIHSNTKGSGKTRMIASIANELMRNHNIQVKFSTSTTIINEIKATWDKEERVCTESALLDALSTTQVLIIDDFGTEEVKGWIDERFYSIINERYNNRKITMYTSNYALQDLKYGDRIKSRVKEMVYQIPFPEECVRDYISEKDNSEMLQRLRR